jgi:hypothetical protein
VLAWLDRNASRSPLLAAPADAAAAARVRVVARSPRCSRRRGTARLPWRLELLPYKGLAQVSAFPKARAVAERPARRVAVAVAAPAFRFAPGLSLGYHGEFRPDRCPWTVSWPV